MIKEIITENREPFIKLTNGGIIRVCLDDDNYIDKYNTKCPVCVANCKDRYRPEVTITLTKYKINIEETVDTELTASCLADFEEGIFSLLLKNINLIQTFTEEDFCEYITEFAKHLSVAHLSIYDIEKKEYIIEDEPVY